MKSEEKKREKERVANLASVPPTPPTPAQASDNVAVLENDDGPTRDMARDEPPAAGGAEPSEPEKPALNGVAEAMLEVVCD